MRKILFAPTAYADFQAWQQTKPTIANQLKKQLITLAKTDTLPEEAFPLISPFQGYYAQRLTILDFVVFHFTEKTLAILSCKNQYNKNIKELYHTPVATEEKVIMTTLKHHKGGINMVENQNAIVNQVIELSKNNGIVWRNFKDFKPKRTLTDIDVRRVRSAVKYPKNVMPLTDGYNKYQSYYAFNDNLVLTLTKGKRDDLLILIAGEVDQIEQQAGARRPRFTRNLAVFTDESTGGLITELHDIVHGGNITQSSEDALDVLSKKLF